MSRAEVLRTRLLESIAVRQALLNDAELTAGVDTVVGAIVGSIGSGGKVMLCGNGGSAADAQHLAAELVGRFYLERPPFPAISLSDNVAALTAISNDYNYEVAYAREVRALGKRGDVLIGLSTSGESRNVVEALRAAADLGIITVVLVGALGSSMETEAQLALHVPASNTASIQEGHKLLGHVIFELVEKELCAG
jgi:D-sedoheptulose 7-phosphate isomerase